jgi:hypothetical protein
MAIALLSLASPRGHAQAALFMEEPYGFFGALNPTGHTAIYFERICAETPVKLRRCQAGEMGAVVSRYQGMNGYDWLAIPLLPYLYSVEDPDLVPTHASHEAVARLRNNYREKHLLSLGELRSGNIVHGGWTELVGVAYERRIYVFRFATTSEQDDAFISQMNSAENHSHFELLYSNCADFARMMLNSYFPGTFKRSVFPDAGMTTPKQLAFKLVRYGRKHPEADVKVFEFAQVPGNRRPSKANKTISESLVTTGYAVPITILNPYLAGGLLVDFLARGRYHLGLKHPQILEPDNLEALTYAGSYGQNPESADDQATRAAASGNTDSSSAAVANPGQKETTSEHE